MWLSQSFADVRAGNRVSLSELRLGSLSNSIFGTVMTIEYVLGRLGDYCPASGSLTFVANEE
jgi:hypothetical protein